MEEAVENNIGRRLRSSTKTKPENVSETADGIAIHEKAPTENILLCSERNFEDMNKSNEKDNNCDKINHPGKNPLEIPEIINHVFGYLNANDIIQCRLVCTKWNDISIPFMGKMCQVTVGPHRNVTHKPSEILSPETLNEFCEKLGVTFRAFKLTTLPIPSAKWMIPNLTGFLEDQRQNMEKLTIDNNIVQLYKCWHDDYFSIDPYISNNLTHLTINNSNFAVSSDKLMAVKSLSLSNCRVYFVNNCRLQPEKLEMKEVEAMNEAGPIKFFEVNDHISFENLRELILGHDRQFSHFPSKILIDLDDCDGVLENLVLENVIVENLDECKWEVKGKIKLRGIPFERKSQMEFTELDFGYANLNLGALPNSIEKLTLEMGEMNVNIYSPPHFALPNLNYFQLSSEIYLNLKPWNRLPEQPLSSLALFANCLNLKTIKIKLVDKFVLRHLNTDWIPRSVQNLLITGKIKIVGNPIQTKRLVIKNNMRLENLREALGLLKTNHLVMSFGSKRYFTDTFADFEEFILNLIELPYDSLAIGPLDLSEIAANKGVFWQQVDVDKESQYYLFENQKGKAITAQEFRKLVDQ